MACQVSNPCVSLSLYVNVYSSTKAAIMLYQFKCILLFKNVIKYAVMDHSDLVT